MRFGCALALVAQQALADPPTLLQEAQAALSNTEKLNIKDHWSIPDSDGQRPQLPGFMYGTAWKKERTAGLVFEALQAGFTAIDTANQQKHYNEVGVGEGVKMAIDRLGKQRSRLFIQTKYSHGQWRDSSLNYTEQVHLSVQQSLAHLGVAYLDSLLLHGPLDKKQPTLPAGDWEAWRAMESLQASGVVRRIGVSNVNTDQLRELLGKASVKPWAVQKRTFARNRWEKDMRDLCAEHGVVFQVRVQNTPCPPRWLRSRFPPRTARLPCVSGDSNSRLPSLGHEPPRSAKRS
jgi:diketogulonate reductase-like aldo/keto reductase